MQDNLMVYFVRRYGNMFNDYGPKEKLAFIVQATGSSKSEEGGIVPKNPKVIFGNMKEEALEKSFYRIGFMPDTVVDGQHNLVKELFDKKKGIS
jgi:hypothetical protein